jgi:hypothetical protein
VFMLARAVTLGIRAVQFERAPSRFM